MKNVPLLVAALLLVSLKSLAQKADYAAAEKFTVSNLQKQVGSLEILPRFSGKNLFWFLWEDKNKKKAYYFVNANNGYQQRLNDKAFLANVLSKFKNKKIDSAEIFFPDKLLIEKDRILFQYGGKEYYYNFLTQAVVTDTVKKSAYSNHGIGTLSFNKQWLLYARNHNLFLTNLQDSSSIALSTDARQYYSFSITESDTSAARMMGTNAVWLSDSKHFYVVREDNRKVETLSLVHASSFMRPWVETNKYQLPGDKHVRQYELFIGDVNAGKMQQINISRWADQEITMIKSALSLNEIYFTRKKRTCDEIELCAVNILTGSVRVIIHEQSKPVINGELFNVQIINGGKDILWWSDRTGWGQYYLYDSLGNLKNAITKGNWTAGKIVFIDTLKRYIYLYGYGKEAGRNPYLQHLYKVGFDGKQQLLLTPENADHKVFISPDGNYFVDEYSRIDSDPKVVLRNNAGKWIAAIITPDVSALYQYGWKKPEPFSVKAADGVTDLYGIMWRPFNFDSTKRYPIISQVYPGPQIETVWPNFTVFDKYNNTSLAQVGFVVVVMGHRGGSPLRNKAYFTYGYGNFRDYALADDQFGLQQLARKYSFVDSTHIGIFGHSGGGAMAAAAICTYPDFYKVAVASAGNYDNSIYFRSWGETFQGIQEISDTVTGKSSFRFRNDNVASLAKNFKGHLLLVTGETDDNVHPGNTYRLADALIKANKDFDMLVLPGQNHHYEGIYKTYFENRQWHYFAKYLMEN